jgi:hypothetical protein
LFSGDVTRAIIPFSLIASRPFTINNMYQPKEGHFRQAAEGQDKMEMPRRNKFYKNKKSGNFSFFSNLGFDSAKNSFFGS